MGFSNSGVDIFLDDVSFGYYRRSRNWVAGANLRIAELRTQPINFKVLGQKPKGAKLKISMREQPFPFWAKFGMEQYEEIQEEWKYYFNYGYYYIIFCIIYTPGRLFFRKVYIITVII